MKVFVAKRVFGNLAAVLTISILLTTGIWSCGPRLFLSARNLEVFPATAVPGDTVSYTLFVTVVPSQEFAVVGMIDGIEHVSADVLGVYEAFYTLTIGGAAELIAAYGTGTHRARVEIRLKQSGKVVRSNEAFFTLSAGP